jgi:hypothetical protein
MYTVNQIGLAGKGIRKSIVVSSHASVPIGFWSLPVGFTEPTVACHHSDKPGRGVPLESVLWRSWNHLAGGQG